MHDRNFSASGNASGITETGRRQLRYATYIATYTTSFRALSAQKWSGPHIKIELRREVQRVATSARAIITLRLHEESESAILHAHPLTPNWGQRVAHLLFHPSFTRVNSEAREGSGRNSAAPSAQETYNEQENTRA